MRATSNIVISIRSSSGSSRACATGRIPRFIAMYARDCFRSTGAATLKRRTISASDDDDDAAAFGGLRLRLILLRHEFSSFGRRGSGAATWAPRQDSDERVDQAQAHGGNRVRDVAFRPHGQSL